MAFYVIVVLLILLDIPSGLISIVIPYIAKKYIYQTFVNNSKLLRVKSRSALQVAMKIAPCDRAFSA